MLELTFDWSDTIENIKDKIHKEFSVPRKQQILLFNENKLDNVKQVTEYEIKNKTVVVLVKDESVSMEEGDYVV
jgi:DTW domain-containing protein YfiP